MTGERTGPRRPAAALARGLLVVLSPGSGAVGLGLLALVLAVALIGPLVATASPFAMIGSPFHPPSGRAPLGTDILGRDVLARVLVGGRQLLGLSAVATLFGVAAGGLLGVAASWTKPWLIVILVAAIHAPQVARVAWTASLRVAG